MDAAFAGLGASGRPAPAIRAVLAAVAVAAIAGPALLVGLAPPPVPPRLVAAHRRPLRIVPPAELPPVEPVAIEDLTADEARAFNAGVPLSTEPNPPAAPLRLVDAVPALARATDCLAAGVYYEAGDDAIGERAVAQVVVNRLRHPAFPKTVCGVVFQGSERSTGCQFTFTCDGSIARRQPSPLAWARAREVATAALRGGVFGPVGWATHYHADFVVPYWQSSLDKLVEVHTQLFYRWTGWWGTARAFVGRPQPDEPLIAALAPLSDAHRDPATPETAVVEGATIAAGAPPPPVATEEGSFLFVLPSNVPPDGYRVLAEATCGDRAFCRFLAWRDRRQLPAGLPLDTAQVASMGFSYLRDRASGYEKALWNCHETARRDPHECMKQQALTGAAPSAPGVADTPTPAPTPSPAAGLDGVRHRLDGPAPAGG